MQKMSHKMIMFAVIAVIIVAVPISFYELSYKPNPPISVINGYSYYRWDANFYNHANETCPLYLPYVNSSAVIDETGYQNSTLLLSIHGYETNTGSEGQRPYFIICLNVSGSLPSNLRPKSLVISQNLSAPGWDGWTQISDGFFMQASASKRANLSLCSSQQYHTPSLAENGSWNCILPFNHEISSNDHNLYNFSFRSASIYGWLLFPNSNVTFYTNISVEILGLSKLVIARDEFALLNVQTM